MFDFFTTDRRGSVAIIVALLFLPMLVSVGAAIDFARYEIYRVRLQNAVDRGVLAAASLNQTQPTRETIEDYVGVNTLALGVDVDFSETAATNARTVTATALYTMPTAFLNLIGIDTLDVAVSATAMERRQNIEISLVLDLSGTMRWEGRIEALRPAAQEFIDTLLAENAGDYTSINMVPYAGDVGVGFDIFNALGGARSHNQSSCFEFTDAEYRAGVVSFEGRAQVPHFTHYNAYPDHPDLNPGWCPSDNSAITPLGNDPVALRARIAGYEMYDGTGTASGMKWAMMLLDPALQPWVAQAAQFGIVDGRFADRPAAFDAEGTRKFIVLMTDGNISTQFRGNTVAQNYQTTTKFSASQARQQFFRLCNDARSRGVTVFTIAFMVAAQHRQEMRDCASSPSHFYEVNDLDIASAFRSIATAIQKIKLVG